MLYENAPPICSCASSSCIILRLLLRYMMRECLLNTFGAILSRGRVQDLFQCR